MPFNLPMQRMQKVSKQAAPDPLELAKAALDGKRVLVVEDNGVLCYSLEQALIEARCEVVGPYARLAEAMQKAPHQQIDLALLDINLRGEFVSR